MNELIDRLVQAGFTETQARQYADQMFPDGPDDVDAAVDEVVSFAADRVEGLVFNGLQAGDLSVQEAVQQGVPRAVAEQIAAQPGQEETRARTEEAAVEGDAASVGQIGRDVLSGDAEADDETLALFQQSTYPAEYLAALGPVSISDIQVIEQKVRDELIAAGYDPAFFENNVNGGVQVQQFIMAGLQGGLDGDLNQVIQSAVASVPVQATVIQYRDVSSGSLTQQVVAADRFQNVVGITNDLSGAQAVFAGVLQVDGDVENAGWLALHLANQGAFTDRLQGDLDAASRAPQGPQLDVGAPIDTPGIFDSLLAPVIEQSFGEDNVANAPPEADPLGQVFGVQFSPTVMLQMRVQGASQEFQRYADQFGRPELALVAMEDPELARRVYESAGGPTAEDSFRIGNILRGYDSAALGAAGFDEASPYVQYMLGGPAGSLGNGSGGRDVTVTLPDETGLREQVRALYQSLLLRDPTEAEEAGAVQNLYSAIRANADYPGMGADGEGFESQYNPFRETGLDELFGGGGPGGSGGSAGGYDEDISTSITDVAMRQLRSNPEFAQLYANRPDGMSELQYGQEFAGATRSAIGNGSGLALEAQRAGMLTGDTNTSFARAMYSEQGLRSATVKDRLANAALAISRFT